MSDPIYSVAGGLAFAAAGAGGEEQAVGADADAEAGAAAFVLAVEGNKWGQTRYSNNRV